MKHLIRIVLFFIILQSAKAQSFNPQLAARLQDTLNKYCTLITNIKGMSAGVYLPGQGIWKGSYGLSHAGQPITADKVFGIASNSKLFVAAAMLKLAENNIISLDDSLHEWLPTYPNINPNITIRQLLNHKSGVPDPFFSAPWKDTIMNNPTRVFTPTEVMGWIGPPLFNPGAGWSYSNTNYVLAGMVAESATGMHISKIIRDSLLAPPGLDTTFYDVEEPETGVIAHRWYNNVDYHDTARVGLNTSAGAAGAIFSTSGEMVQWYHALMSRQILDSASFADLTTFVTTWTAYTYGLGLERQAFYGRITYGHGGSTWGYKSRMVYDSCSGAVVCGLANSWPAGSDGVTLLLYKVLVEHLPGCPGTISGPASVCRHQNAVTYIIPLVTNASSYIWTLPSGATGSSIANTITVDFGPAAVSGNIIVKGVNTYGESAPALFPVTVQTVPTGIAVNDPVLTANATAANYQWLDCNNAFAVIPSETNQSFTAAVNGSYAVQLTVNGCVDTSACIDIYAVGMSETNKVDGIEIYPNPAHDQITLQVSAELLGSSFSLNDLLGQTLIAGRIIRDPSVISIKELSGGIYILHIGDDQHRSFRVMKQ
jgi:D-alanyl-D-alanine carboxypeptidase